VTETPPPLQDPPRSPATTLQTTPPEKEAALEQDIRKKLDRAAADLSRVDYGRLNQDARGQYDQAKRFATQAAEYVAVKNLVYALRLADLAATMAAQLASR
jgi:hypothetical protein